MKNKNKIISLVIGIILTITIISAATIHYGKDILVSVGSGEMSLQEAIANNELCYSGSTTSYTNNKLNPGHYATEMELSSGKNLQKAIDDGDFCGQSLTYCDSRNCGPDTCGGYCGEYYDNAGCEAQYVAGYSCYNGNCCTPVTDCTGKCGPDHDDGCGGTYNCSACETTYGPYVRYYGYYMINYVGGDEAESFCDEKGDNYVRHTSVLEGWLGETHCVMRRSLPLDSALIFNLCLNKAGVAGINQLERIDTVTCSG